MLLSETFDAYKAIILDRPKAFKIVAGTNTPNSSFKLEVGKVHPATIFKNSKNLWSY